MLAMKWRYGNKIVDYLNLNKYTFTSRAMKRIVVNLLLHRKMLADGKHLIKVYEYIFELLI